VEGYKCLKYPNMKCSTTKNPRSLSRQPNKQILDRFLDRSLRLTTEHPHHEGHRPQQSPPHARLLVPKIKPTLKHDDDAWLHQVPVQYRVVDMYLNMRRRSMNRRTLMFIPKDRLLVRGNKYIGQQYIPQHMIQEGQS
jgi:hypothetical protein